MTNKQEKVKNLGLGTRAEKALRKLGIDNVGKLLKFDAAKVLSIRGCGKTVYQRIIATQERLKLDIGKRAPKQQDPAKTYAVITSSMGSWTRRCLGNLGIKNLRDLSTARLVDFLSLDGFGLTTWNEIFCAREHAIQQRPSA